MLRGLVRTVALLGSLAAAGCSKPAPEPLRLEQGTLTVDNQSADEWTNVEIWVNQYFRVTAPSIAARSRFQVPLDAFVSGYGRRFDRKRMQVKDLRLSAKTPAGQAVQIKMQLQKGGLAGALGGRS
jgi:hypothetical protein